MLKIIFKTPIEIIQDGLKAIALFIYPGEVDDKGTYYLLDGNKIDKCLIKGVEWEA